MSKNILLPKYSSSYWKQQEEIQTYPALEENIDADAVVVGGGIAGLLTAYNLCKAGRKTVLLEGTKLLDGTTGFTTAKITAQHDVMYDELIQNKDEETARAYYEAQTEALKMIEALIHTENIDCGYKKQDAVLHAGTSKGKKELRQEKKAYEKLGIDHEFSEFSDLPFHTEAALVMKDQAHFHPVQFLKQIAEKIVEMGGKIYEGTTAVDFKGKDPVVVETRNGGTVTCAHLVIATHFPFKDSAGMYFSRLHPSRSYTIAVKTKSAIPEGMYLGFDEPSFSLRHAEAEGEKLAIIGGESHKTGTSENTLAHYQRLMEFAVQEFGAYEVVHRWSSQDLKSLDGVPYIGQAVTGTPNVYVATGFKKWGMTNGMAAASLLTDIITGQDNKFAPLFDPRRTHAKVQDGLTLMKETMDDGKQMVKSHLKRKEEDVESLEKDEGAIVKVNGKKTGAYRDEHGELHLVNPICTHMKCGVEWNNAERSWDCPCHGSRFSTSGEVIEGPAYTPLEQVSADDNDSN